jgi:hypothetical protein
MNKPDDLDDHALVAAATCQYYLARPDLCIDAGEALLDGGPNARQDQIIE